ncbi:MAG: ATP-binding protein [Candidatus Pacebacteria bacterium]|nr:ATP-binding protein [Candidatus Paceibacterota bacterium]
MQAENNFFKKREKELVEDAIVLEKAIKSFWEILPIPVCTTSPIFIILETGKSFNALFGYGKDEVIGENLKTIAADKESFQKALREISQKKKISDFEVALQAKDGKKLLVLVSAIAQEDEAGEVASFLFSFVDITLMKKTERELQEKIADSAKQTQELIESKQALLNILEDVEESRVAAEKEKNKTLALITNFSDGVLFFDSKNKLSLANIKVQTFFNVKYNEIIGSSLEELGRFENLKPLIDLIGSGQKTINREELILSSGLVLEITTVSIEFEKQKLGTLLILHDITREKSVERLKTEFVSIAAHQLRTPLSAIKWILRMFLDGDMGEISETQAQFLQKTYDSNERMINLVNDLLNVTRIEEGKFLEKMQQQDIFALLKEAVGPLEEKIKEKGLDFSLALPDKKAPKMDVDKEKVILAVQNLLENAINYTKTGAITLTGEYNAAQKEFLIKVQDTGIGIPKEQHERVFSRFFRSSNALKTETEGTGLGLFIFKNIVEAHGGKVWFESEEGKGTTFYFTLPVNEKLGNGKLGK